MKSPKIDQRLYIPFILLCIVNAAGLQAETLAPDQYLVWGISSDDVQIPAGSVVEISLTEPIRLIVPE